MAAVELLQGYAACLVAVLFFGSCYVPAKQYPTYDGIIFQWFMCSGVLMVGLAWGLISNNWSEYAKGGLYVFPEGLIGGSLFATANLLIPTVVNNLGLGIGFMLWNGTNVAFGYAISRYGLLGVEPTVSSRPLLSEFGILCMVLSVAVYGSIKPQLAHESMPHHRLSTGSGGNGAGSDGDAADENSQLLEEQSPRGYNSTMANVITHSSRGKLSMTDALIQPELPNFGPYMMAAEEDFSQELEHAAQHSKRRFIATCLAVLVGAILSSCLVPYVRWQQGCRPALIQGREQVISTCNPLNFVFSQCLGVYIASTVFFLVYSLLHRFVLRRGMPRSVMRPAYLCGVLWAIGLGGQLYSAWRLGFDESYPLSSIGPAMVSMLWSACYFGEIQGRKNTMYLVLGTSLVLLGTLLRAIAK